MGYRSNVAYVIKFNSIEDRDAFVALMEARGGVPTQPIITLDEAHARYRSLAAELKELNESAAWARKGD